LCCKQDSDQDQDSYLLDQDWSRTRLENLESEHLCYVQCVRNLPFALAPLERRFVLDGTALIRSWRGAVLFCDSQSWRGAELSSRLLLFFFIYLFSACFVQMCWSSTH